jgi:hypothetical protein
MSEIRWRKSTYSQPNNNCVELSWRTSTYSQPNNECVELSWRISTYSQPNNDCVELTRTTDLVVVRDSKNPDGPTLTFDSARFLASVKA